MPVCSIEPPPLCCLSVSACRRIRGLGMEVCTTLGMLTPEQVCAVVASS